MYFLRSNKSNDNSGSDCEIDLNDLLNNDIIKKVFSDVLKDSMKEFNEKISKLENEVVMLRESNIELISLLTNGETLNNVQKCSNSKKLPSTNPETNPSKTHEAKSRNNKNSQVRDKISSPQIKTNNYKNTEEKQFKHPTRSIDDCTTKNKPMIHRRMTQTTTNKQQQKRTPLVVYGTGTGNKSNLTAVNRKTWIYVGRVTPGTGVDGLKEHIEIIFPEQETLIEMLPKWKNGETEAFKVGIDHDLLDEAFNSKNWPKGSLIKKYKFFQG